MWVFGGSGEPDKKCNIDEANKHLNAMSQKIEELEKTVEEQKQEMDRRDEVNSQCIKEFNNNHHIEVDELRSKIKDHLSTIRCLQSDVKRRDSELNVLRQRVRILDEVMRYKASLAKLTITLEQAEQYSRAMAGRNGHLSADPRLSGGSTLAVYTEPSPRALPFTYVVDEMPEDELIDHVGVSSVNAAAAAMSTKPTLAEKAASARTNGSVK